MKAIKVKLDTGRFIPVYEQHVCYVTLEIKDGKEYAGLHMTNGDILLCEQPPFDDWYNDCLLSES